MKKKAIQILIALILFLLAIFIPFPFTGINYSIFIVSYLIVGFEVIREAFQNLLKGKVLDENFLMAVATIGAFAIGEFPEAVAVMLFYQIGEWFQGYAVDKSRKSIASLMDIRPDYAYLDDKGEIKKVTPTEVKIGDTILVKPGDKVPLDGIIIEGQTTLDTKALTGESLPKEVIIGDEVLSGCINLNGTIRIQTTKNFGESTVSKILDLVENVSSKKSKSENFITKFAHYYTPIVVIIALLLAVLPPLLIPNATFLDWLYRALSFLVVSCPCALVISVPLSFFGGIGGASKMGILIKGSNYIETLANTKIVVFDKTGTLTEGSFKVQKVVPIGISQEEMLKLAAHSEYYSNHPIAHSILESYSGKIDEKQIEKTEELSGFGISAKIGNKNILIGNGALLQKNNIPFTKCSELGTILYMAIENQYVGYILIADQIKSDAKKTIQELKQNHIKQTVMLTGDRKDVGESVAKTLGMDTVYTELLPDEKVEKVEELLKTTSEKSKLAFVGDGINDAPVLALADIGIAMGGLGADSAIEAADIVIMTDEPSKIIEAIHLAKKTMQIVKQNIIFAIFIKVSVLGLTAIGLSTMWEAVFADVGVSVIAILNALRALKVKERKKEK